MSIAIRKMFLIPVLIGVALFSFATSAQAAFKVKFEFGAASIILDASTATSTVAGGASVSGATITFDNTSGAKEITVTNLVVSTAGTTGGFKITATFADSNSPGSPAGATLDVGSLNIRNQTGVAGTSTLTISVTDTAFTVPAYPNTSLLSTVSGTTPGTNSASAKVVFDSYVDTTNTEFGTQQSTPTITLDPIAAGSSLSGNTSAVVTATAPYSLSNVLKVTLSDANRLSDGSAGTTLTNPAPASILLALTALPALGLVYRRRRPATPTVSQA